MNRSRSRAIVAAGALSFAALGSACNAVIGLKDYVDLVGDGGTNGQMKNGTDATIDGDGAATGLPGDDDDAQPGPGDDGEVDARVSSGDTDDATTDSADGGFVVGPDGACLPDTYCALVLEAGPLAYFRFDEKDEAGAEAPRDWSGNGASLLFTGSVSAGPGAPVADVHGAGLAVGADGDAGSYTFKGVKTLSETFTLEAWFAPSAAAQVTGKNTTTQIPFSTYKVEGSIGLGFRVLTGSTTVLPELNVLSYSAGSAAAFAASGPSVLSTSGYTHVAAVFNAGAGHMYLNGVAGTSTGSVVGSANSLALPLAAVGLFGAIDEVAVYGRALSGAEVAAHARFPGN